MMSGPSRAQREAADKELHESLVEARERFNRPTGG